jgi:diphosphomevalonate decarboxylase
MYALRLSPDVLSGIARQGSGSACRSLQGGFVAWDMGEREDGTDSLARQVADRSHWPELEAVICVVNAGRKDTPSTVGMQRTAATSELFLQRIKLVPERMRQMEAAILAKDFDRFAELTMRDSNQFHACCLDTYPPVVYMNDISHAIVRMVEAFNANGYRAAYTFDAGPNAVIYTLRKHVPELLRWLTHCFPAPSNDPAARRAYFEDPYGVAPQLWDSSKKPIDAALAALPVYPPNSVKQLLHVPVGDGPQVLSSSESLLTKDGLPKPL